MNDQWAGKGLAGAAITMRPTAAHEGWRNLACAIIVQAVKEAEEGNGEARAWLAGPRARTLLDLLGVNSITPEKILAELPVPPQLTLPGIY